MTRRRFGASGSSASSRPRCGRGTTGARCRRCRARLAQPAVDAERRLDVRATPPCRCGRSCRRCAACPTSSATLRCASSSSIERPRCVSLSATFVRRPFGVDAVEHLAVGGDDRARLGLVAHALAEQRRVREEAPLVQPPENRARRRRASRRRRSARRRAGSRTADEALQPRAVRRGEDQAAERRSCAATRRRSARPRPARRRSARAAARARPGHRDAAEAERRLDAAWNGNRCSAARSADALSPASGVGSRTSGTTASGKLAGETGDCPDGAGGEPALEQRLGARRRRRDRRRGTARAAPRAVRDLHPGEVRRALAQPLDHRERDRVAAPRLELVEVERRPARRRGPRPRSARAARPRRAGSTAARSRRRRRRRGRQRARRGATVSRVVCAPQCTAT